MIKQFVVSAVLVGTAFTVQAQQAQASGGYIGASLGRSSVNFKDVIWPVGFAGTDTRDETDTGWRAFGGYQFNPYGALEVGYTNFGNVSRTLTFTRPVAIAGTTLAGKFEANGLVGDIVGTIPVSEQFSLLGPPRVRIVVAPIGC